MQNSYTGEIIPLDVFRDAVPTKTFRDAFEEMEEKKRLIQEAADRAIPNRDHQGPVFEVGEVIEIKGGKFRVNGFSRKRLYLDSLPFVILMALALLYTGCASTGGISASQIAAAETAATPIVSALAAKYPSDTAAINAAWSIATVLSQGAPVSTTTSPVLASLPAGTSNGTAIAAVNTAIAVLGTPGSHHGSPRTPSRGLSGAASSQAHRHDAHGAVWCQRCADSIGGKMNAAGTFRMLGTTVPLFSGEEEPKSDFMYCISLWQPWAQWVILGWKTIETRTHNRFASLVGKSIGIHAARKWDVSSIKLAERFLSKEQIKTTADFLSIGQDSGKILGTVDVTKSCLLSTEHEQAAMIECQTKRFGLFLENPLPMSPAVSIKGMQGIWKYHLPATQQASTPVAP